MEWLLQRLLAASESGSMQELTPAELADTAAMLCTLQDNGTADVHAYVCTLLDQFVLVGAGATGGTVLTSKQQLLRLSLSSCFVCWDCFGSLSTR